MSDSLRWLIDVYRQALLRADPDACEAADATAASAGHAWVSDSTVVDLDELLTAREIADRHGVAEYAVRARARRRGVQVRGRRGGANVYRLGDILKPLN